MNREPVPFGLFRLFDRNDCVDVVERVDFVDQNDKVDLDNSTDGVMASAPIAYFKIVNEVNLVIPVNEPAKAAAMPELFDKRGGFRKLHTFTLARFERRAGIIIGRALNMLKSQIESQGAAFEETGGFSERLTAKRIEAGEKTREPSPECPQCNKPMRRRTSVKGEFWGCSAYPDCKGTRPV